MCKSTLSSTLGQNEPGATGGGGGPGGHGRWRSGHRGARLSHKTDRGGEDELDGGLTSGEGRWQRPESAGQRRRFAVCHQRRRRLGHYAGRRRGWQGSRGRRQAVQGLAASVYKGQGGGRRARLPRMAAAARPAASALAMAAGQMGLGGLAGWAGAGGAGWVGPLARPNPVA
jgi:hypothetical protein